jgi:hypothetical protein
MWQLLNFANVLDLCALRTEETELFTIHYGRHMEKVHSLFVIGQVSQTLTTENMQSTGHAHSLLLHLPMLYLGL